MAYICSIENDISRMYRKDFSPALRAFLKSSRVKNLDTNLPYPYGAQRGTMSLILTNFFVEIRDIVPVG
jgi:hypothetical protein